MNETGSIDGSASMNDDVIIEEVIVMPDEPEEIADASMVAPSPSAGRDVLLRTLAMSAACLGTIAIASAMRRRSPWSGVNAIATGLGLASRRPAGHYRPIASCASFATMLGGAAVIALVDRAVARRTHAGPVARSVVAAATGAALDFLIMRREMFGALRRSIGPGGIVAKYAAMGIADGLVSRA